MVLGGGLLVLFGFKARFGAFLLFIFTIPVTFVFHSFWNMPADQITNQMHHFMKNISIMGGTLYLMAYGAGRFGFDRKSGT